MLPSTGWLLDAVFTSFHRSDCIYKKMKEGFIFFTSAASTSVVGMFVTLNSEPAYFIS